MKTIQFVVPVVAGLLLAACGQKQEESAPPVSCTPQAVDEVKVVELVPGLTSKILTTGCGTAAQNGHTAAVHYTGWLFDADSEKNRGSKFDSSRDRGQHFRFPLGGGSVIEGWDRGVVGMTIGEVRELTIAPELAYGDSTRFAAIPPGSTLVFEVELAGLEGEPSPPPAAAEGEPAGDSDSS